MLSKTEQEREQDSLLCFFFFHVAHFDHDGSLHPYHVMCMYFLHRDLSKMVWRVGRVFLQHDDDDDQHHQQAPFDLDLMLSVSLVSLVSLVQLIEITTHKPKCN
jgi:hypothetical protein